MVDKDQVDLFVSVGWKKVTPTKLTWWKRLPEEQEGLVRNQESGPVIKLHTNKYSIMRIQDLLERQTPIAVDDQAEEIMNTVFYDQLEDLEDSSGLVKFCNILNRASKKFGIAFEAAPKMSAELDGNAYDNGEIKISLNDGFRVKLQDPDTQDDSLNQMRSMIVHELVHREQGVRSQGRAFFVQKPLKKISDPEHSDLADPHEIRAYAGHIIDYLRNSGFSDRDIAQAVQYQPQRLNQSPQWQLYQKVFGSYDPYRVLNKLKKTIMDLVTQ